MKKKELKEKKAEELIVEKDKLIREYRDIKFKKVTGVIENPLKLRTIRRGIARINTILHSRELDRMKKEIKNLE